MENKPAFSYDQIVQYMGKLRKRSQIDHPGASVQFITQKESIRQRQGPPTLKQGQIGTIQWNCLGQNSQSLDHFTCAYEATLEKSFWIPLETLTYSQMKYAGFDPI